MNINAAFTAYSSQKAKTLLSACTLIAASLVSQSAFAEKEPIANYTIEVIIFENHALKGWTEELWPNEIELPSTEVAVDLALHGKHPLWIEPQNKNLTDVTDRMRRDYKILFHKAWSQNAMLPDETPMVLIESQQSEYTNVTGTLKLYKTRFAHVQFDLEVEKRIPEKVREAFANNQQISLEYLPTHWRFNLQESRKIKPGQLHYIDHPLFGILVQIKKNS
ncbi:MAG: hypothetical protein ISEC1_P0592 [Thiomicrorhabdus sp.]|nr:MAG: hypothetical protein ISEC1_P0592 [Thiomicrorhabdus sp.]